MDEKIKVAKVNNVTKCDSWLKKSKLNKRNGDVKYTNIDFKISEFQDS